MKIYHIPKEIALVIIKGYQKTLSPDHGIFKHRFPQGYCKYDPSCSEYTYQAITKYGLVKGGIMGTYRILRCNPFSKGGYDPVS